MSNAQKAEDMSIAQIDAVLERFDQTEPSLQRRIIVQAFMDVAVLRARADRAEAALHRFGNHDEDCVANPEYDGEDIDESKCDCGFTAALAAAAKEARNA